MFRTICRRLFWLRHVKAAVKLYIKGESRLSKLLNELERRKTTKYLNICGNFIVINGERFQALAAIEENKEKLGLADTGWVDVENKILGLELKEFLPNIYIYDRPYDDFIRYWPEKVHKNGNGTVDLLTDEFQLRCTFENEQLVYAEITSLFRIWIKEKDSPALTKVLAEVFELSAKTAEQAVRNAENYSGEWEIKPFTGERQGQGQVQDMSESMDYSKRTYGLGCQDSAVLWRKESVV